MPKTDEATCTNIPTQFDVTKLKDSSVVEAFQFELVNKFHLASAVWDVKDECKQFRAAVKWTAEMIIGFKQNLKSKKWISDYILKLIEQHKKTKVLRDQAKMLYFAQILDRNHGDLDKAVKKSCMKDRNTWIQKQCNQTELAATCNDTKLIYKNVRQLTAE